MSASLDLVPASGDRGKQGIEEEDGRMGLCPASIAACLAQRACNEPFFLPYRRVLFIYFTFFKGDLQMGLTFKFTHSFRIPGFRFEVPTARRSRRVEEKSLNTTEQDKESMEDYGVSVWDGAGNLRSTSSKTEWRKLPIYTTPSSYRLGREIEKSIKSTNIKCKCNSNSFFQNTYSRGFMCMINKKKKEEMPKSYVQYISINSEKPTSLISIITYDL
jgi:hypothetical protein